MEENYTKELPVSKGAKNFFDIFEPIIYALLAVVMISLFLGRLTVVDGESMENKLSNGEYLVVSNFMRSYTPKQGDIVVVRGNFEGEYYDKPIVKRVVATGGQTVRIQFYEDKDAEVFVDGKLFEVPSAIYIDKNTSDIYSALEVYEYNYLGYKLDGTPMKNASPYYNYDTKVFEITVPEGEYFMMGDNRYNSADSRINEIGCIPTKYILGKAVFRLTPLKKLGGLYND